MARRTTPAATRRRATLPLRFAAIWLALAVALLSSLLSSGLPRTTTFGSAFNPATTAVALKPSRAQPRFAVDAVRRDDDPTSGQGAPALLPSTSVQPAVHPVTAVAIPKPMAAARPIALHAVLDGSPRGPPLA